MKLTPLDIKRQEFKKVLRGYDPVEVDTFMEMMANEYEELLKAQKEMRDKTIELEVQLRDYRQIEKTLQQTLLQAQEATGKTYEAARREAEVIIKEKKRTDIKFIVVGTGPHWKEVVELSMECVMCGMCAARCPAELAPFNIALLVRRMYGKHIIPPSPQLLQRLKEIGEGKFEQELSRLKKSDQSELQERFKELQAKKGAAV